MKKLFSTLFITVLALGMTKAQTVIYSQDFSGGIPASWSNVGTANGVANAHVKWQSRTNQTAASGGQYGSSYGTVASPTVANGYISFDSDSLDEGATGPQASGVAPAPQHVELSLPAINVAGHPAIKFQFYQDLANFQSVAAVAFSKDSINWTIDTVDVNQAANSATAPANQKVSINVTSIVNGGNNLYVRFILDANYYFWAIDDISVIELPNSDLQIKGFAGQSLTAQGLGLFFSEFPSSQDTSVTPVVTYGNVGAAAQPNCVAQISLSRGGTNIGNYTTTPAVASLAVNTDTTDFTTFHTGGVIGSYVSSVYVHSDSTDFDLSNNSDTLKFAITDSVFSINQGNISNSVYFLLRNNFGASFRLGTLFEVLQPDTVTSVTSAFEGGNIGTITLTRPGAVVQASIYPITVGTSLTYSTPTVSTYPTTLTAANISSNTTFRTANMRIDNSSGNAVLQPGIYWVAIKGVSTPDSNIAIMATEYQTNGVPLIEDNSQAGQLSLLSATDAAFCNLNFGHEASLLYVDFTRNPGTSPLRVGQACTFTGISNASNAATYAWTLTGLSTAAVYNGTGKIYRDTFTVADSFNVCVTVTDGGSSATACKIVKVREDGLGVQEVSGLSQTTMIPNPTTGRVNISADGVNGTMVISVVNMLGEEVKSFTETANGSFAKSYNLSDLSNGVYLVKLTNGGTTATKRLSISK